MEEDERAYNGRETIGARGEGNSVVDYCRRAGIDLGACGVSVM